MIFLSASVPDPIDSGKYFETADIVAIRDAVRALATVVIPKSYLVWGGHPAITPLINYVMKTLKHNVQDHILLYQSNYFQKTFPLDNEKVNNVQIIPEGNDEADSLYKMRTEMFCNHQFQAAIFIGGMQGVEDEYNMFLKYHPKALIIPVASTGGAAKVIYDSLNYQLDERLKRDVAYMAVFKDVLKDVINSYPNR
jgi:hypothetical protein